MYTLKGFMLMQPLANNEPNQLSPLGELANISKTFTKDIGHYSSAAYPNVDLMSYISRQVDVEGDDVNIKISNDHKDVVLEIGGWLYAETIAGRITGDASAFMSKFITAFSRKVNTATSGDMVNSGGSNWLPEWLSFTVIGGEDNNIKLWFSDAAFYAQFDEYEIVVVPQVDDIDSLFQQAVHVKALLDLNDPTTIQDRITAARNGYPETITRTIQFEWVNPVEPDITLSTPWSVVIYGPAGDNPDSIKAAIADYILSNSARPREDWINFLPDVFRSTEYLIVPTWDHSSIPNETLSTGLNSPFINASSFNRHVAYVRDELAFYPPQHIDDYIEYSVANYKSIGFFVIGSEENKDASYSLFERFSDYIVIPSNSSDYSRISPETRGFIFELGRLLNAADIATEFSDIPIGMSKLIRNNRLFITKSYQDVLYVVQARSSYVRPTEVELT